MSEFPPPRTPFADLRKLAVVVLRAGRDGVGSYQAAIGGGNA
jgi:hypothetical protein